MSELAVGIACRDLSDDAPPQPRGSQHVGFVHRGHKFASTLCRLERNFCHTFNFRYTVDHRIPGAVAVALFLARTKVNATCQFADEQDIDIFEQFSPHRRMISQHWIGFDWTQISEQSEMCPQTQ